MTEEPMAYLNGEFIPRSRLTIDAADAGFVYGATVTDFCRTYNQKLFRWDDHMARLRRDCREGEISLIESDSELSAIATELLARNPPDGQERAIITFATPGPLPGRSAIADIRPTLGMQTLPIEASRYQRFFDNGVTLEHVPIPIPNFLNPVKHRNRLHWWLASAGCKISDSVAMLSHPDHSGVDTAIGSVLLVNHDGEVVVSKPGSVLESISCNVVLELCRSLNIPMRTDLTMEQLQGNMAEVMLAGSGFGLAGVREIHTDDDIVLIRCPGPITLRLQQAWSGLVGCDITVIPEPS